VIEEGDGIDEGVILEVDVKFCVSLFEVDKYVKILFFFGFFDVIVAAVLNRF
jgi:hypothetical protein